VTLNREAALEAGLSFNTLADRTAELLLEVPGITHALPRRLLDAKARPPLRDLWRDVHPTRSPDVLFLIEKYAMFAPSGTDHGTQFDYDRRVPLMFLGRSIVAVHDVDGGSPTDIAPTLAAYLGIDLLTEPDGRVLTEVFFRPKR
jgi:hypothetical protein